MSAELRNMHRKEFLNRRFSDYNIRGPRWRRDTDCDEEGDDEECRSKSSSAASATSTTLETVTTKTLFATSTSTIISTTFSTTRHKISASSTEPTTTDSTASSTSTTSSSQTDQQSSTLSTTTSTFTGIPADQTAASTTGTLLGQASPTPLATDAGTASMQTQNKSNPTAIVLIVLAILIVLATASFLLIRKLRQKRSDDTTIPSNQPSQKPPTPPESPSRNVVSLGREVAVATDDYSEKGSLELSVITEDVSTMDTSDIPDHKDDNMREESVVASTTSSNGPVSHSANLVSGSSSKIGEKVVLQDGPLKTVIQRTPTVVRRSQRLQQTDLYLIPENSHVEDDKGKMVFDIVRKGKDGEIENVGRREVV